MKIEKIRAARRFLAVVEIMAIFNKDVERRGSVELNDDGEHQLTWCGENYSACAGSIEVAVDYADDTGKIETFNLNSAGAPRWAA